MSQRNQRDKKVSNDDISGKSALTSNNLINTKGNFNNFESDGLDKEELYGLNLEERKRQRC